MRKWSSFNEWYMVLLSRPASKCYSAKIKTLWGNLDDHEFWDSMVFGHVSYPKFFTKKKSGWNFRIHPIWNHYNSNRAYVSNRGSFNLPSEIYQQVWTDLCDWYILSETTTMSVYTMRSKFLNLILKKQSWSIRQSHGLIACKSTS